MNNGNLLKNEYSIEDWDKAEKVALKYIKLANQWLQGFYSTTSKENPLYHIQFTDESQIEPPILNTATYQITSSILDYEPSFISVSEQKEWEEVREQSRKILKAFNDGTLLHTIPLEDFGILPLFSTCYRAEVMGLMDNPLKLDEYAIVIRRIVFELSRKQERQRSYPQKVDKLHPFLLFRCSKSLIKLLEKVKANKSEIKEFHS
jgi:hypothetical protein